MKNKTKQTEAQLLKELAKTTVEIAMVHHRNEELTDPSVTVPVMVVSEGTQRIFHMSFSYNDPKQPSLDEIQSTVTEKTEKEVKKLLSVLGYPYKLYRGILESYLTETDNELSDTFTYITLNGALITFSKTANVILFPKSSEVALADLETLLKE